jgi:hypothetical protein
MSQYSLFTHGNALRVEDPGSLANHYYVGWGAVATFRAPVAQQESFGIVYDEVGPGSWFHLPLTSTLTTFGRFNPSLKSVTLLFDTSHCRITNVHVYDGAAIVHEFNGLRLKGDFLTKRDTNDINPDTAVAFGAQAFSNTLTLPRPRKVFSAIGVSFFACAFFEDFNERGRAHDPRFDGPFPPAVLTVAGAGGQYLVEDRSFLTVSVSAIDKVGILIGP